MKGSYRVYYKLPFINYGIKIARFNIKSTNTYCVFLCGIIMNILERKRYLRYVKNKKYKYKWKPSNYSLCPTYFTFFGLFNIVKHANKLPDNWFSLNKKCAKKYKKSPFVESADKLDSYGIINGDYKTGQLVEIDYGDFTIYSYNIRDVKEVDYK